MTRKERQWLVSALAAAVISGLAVGTPLGDDLAITTARLLVEVAAERPVEAVGVPLPPAKCVS